MKNKIIVSALLVLLFSAVMSVNANAAPWRGCRHGWYGPRVGVRVWVPPVRVVVPAPVVYGGYYGGGYGGPHYYAHGGYGHYGHRYGGHCR